MIIVSVQKETSQIELNMETGDKKEPKEFVCGTNQTSHKKSKKSAASNSYTHTRARVRIQAKLVLPELLESKKALSTIHNSQRHKYGDAEMMEMARPAIIYYTVCL